MSEDYWGRIDRTLATLQTTANRIDQKCDMIQQELQHQRRLLMLMVVMLGLLLLGVFVAALTFE